MGKQQDVVTVLGRANVDLVIHVRRLPSAGRAAFGSPLTTTAGGKALNQAVTVARLGGVARLVANVGGDVWGHLLAGALSEAGVDTAGFRLIANATTGAAIIAVTPDGESYVCMALSPETELTPADVAQVLAGPAPSAMVTQLDLAPDVVHSVLQAPRPRLLVGNLEPHPEIDRQLLGELDLYIVNEEEAAAVLGAEHVEAAEAVAELQKLGPRAVVVTAGARGAFYSRGTGIGAVVADAVEVVDTTGAGDAFLGALVLSMTRGSDLEEAVAVAVRAGGLAAQHSGALLPPLSPTQRFVR
ncbi:PfkB family carbohydrate kinase [Actinoplanes sp. NPDC051343]|uniref:PfkB family carbohydrate kinase n=1 Tax=Actinoplanes sp. NPDC051343 TaxID=3363906 RepID=UPI0037922190